MSQNIAEMTVTYGHKVDESRLWSDFKNGDETAFSHLYSKYVVQLYNYGERLTSDKALIEDSIHDLFVELWRNRVSIGTTTSVKFYLFKSFKNRLIKNLQKKRKYSYSNISDDYQFEIVFSPEFELIAQQVSIAQKENLLKAINELAPRQKQALTLKVHDELSYDEIAHIMVLPVKSVYMLIYRAVSFLKENVKFQTLSMLLFAWVQNGIT